MSDSTLTNLSAATTPLDGTESIYIVQGGNSRKATVADVSGGSGGQTIARRTSSSTIDDSAYQWNGNTDAGDITFTLPAGIANTQYKVANTGTSGNTLSLLPDGSENLLGANSAFDLSDGETLVIMYEETDGWY